MTHATTYTIYKSVSSTGTFSSAGTATGTTWTSGALTSGSTYYWKITATIGSNWASTQSAASAGRTITYTNSKYGCS